MSSSAESVVARQPENVNTSENSGSVKVTSQTRASRSLPVEKKVSLGDHSPSSSAPNMIL